jgi:hypothetical protein
MKKQLGNILTTVLSIALLVYTATRSLDFIQMTLPEGRQLLAWFALAALDGGLIGWLMNYMYSAQGGMQRAISLLMVIIDFLGVAAMFTLDTLVNTGNAGMTTRLDPASMMTAVLVLSGIITLNIGSTLAHYIYDPGRQKEKAEEEIQEKIEELALKNLKQNAPTLAAKLAPAMASDWLSEINARNVSGIKSLRSIKVPELPAPVAAIPASATSITSTPAPETTEPASTTDAVPVNPTKRQRKTTG